MKILFCRGHGFLASLVRWQTWGKYSHVAIQIGNYIYEAVPPRVRKVHVALYDWRGVDAFNLGFPTNSNFEQYIQGFLEAEIGKKYDYCGVLRFLPRWKSQNSKRWFCSELVLSVFKRAHVDLLVRVDAVKVSPSLLSYSPSLHLDDPTT